MQSTNREWKHKSNKRTWTNAWVCVNGCRRTLVKRIHASDMLRMCADTLTTKQQSDELTQRCESSCCRRRMNARSRRHGCLLLNQKFLVRNAISMRAVSIKEELKLKTFLIDSHNKNWALLWAKIILFMSEWALFDAGARSCGNYYEWNRVRWLSAFYVYIGVYRNFQTVFKYNWMWFQVMN